MSTAFEHNPTATVSIKADGGRFRLYVGGVPTEFTGSLFEVVTHIQENFPQEKDFPISLRDPALSSVV